MNLDVREKLMQIQKNRKKRLPEPVLDNNPELVENASQDDEQNENTPPEILFERGTTNKQKLCIWYQGIFCSCDKIKNN